MDRSSRLSRCFSSLCLVAVLVAALLVPSSAGARPTDVNAHKVDGFHAIGCGEFRSSREAQSLVATCQDGRLPNGIISMAPNARRLKGKSLAGVIRMAQRDLHCTACITAEELTTSDPAAAGKLLAYDGNSLTWLEPGDGLTWTESPNPITLALDPTYSLPQDCSGGQVAKWNAGSETWVCAGDDSGSAPPPPIDTSRFWSLDGNTGTDPSADFLGTTDFEPVVIKVNGANAFVLDPTSSVPNIVGGSPSHSIGGANVGQLVIGGGAGGANSVAADNASAVGGVGNIVTGNYASTVGGLNNDATGLLSSVIGGTANIASGNQSSAIGGTTATASGIYSSTLGGDHNVASGIHSSVLGGQYSTASGNESGILGGSDNSASAINSGVVGGDHNVASAARSAVLGGFSGIASGAHSVVLGGISSTAAGDISVAGGRRATIDAAHDGTFLWADSNDVNFNSTAANEFAARATGGVRFVTAVNGGTGAPTSGVSLGAGGGSWTMISDRRAKQNFRPVDTAAVLRRIARLPMETWSYKTEDASIRHMGTMAQAFYRAFGLGDSNKTISTIDADGVALAGIKALYRMGQSHRADIESLETKVRRQAKRLRALEAQVNALAKAVTAD